MDRRALAASALIGLVGTVAACFYSFVLYGWIHHVNNWNYPVDVWMLVDGGRFVSNGALGYVYQGSGSYAFPLAFVVFGPVSGLVDHFQLIEGSPFPVAHPSAWVLVGPYSALLGIPLLYAVRTLAWDVGVRSRLWLLQLLTFAVAVMPCWLWGHPEDLLSMTFVVFALRSLRTDRFMRAAFMLSVAVSFKQTAMMLIPLVFFMAPKSQRLRTLAAACVLPAVLAGFSLAVDWADASKALFSPVNLLHHYQGHSAFYISWWGAKTSEISRGCGVLLSVALGWWLRKVRTTPQILAAASMILIVRPFSEAINYSYYWSPGLLLAGCLGVAVHGRVRWRDWIWPALAIVWASPHGTGTVQPWWWLGEMVLVAATALQVAKNLAAAEDPSGGRLQLDDGLCAMPTGAGVH